MLLEQAFFLLFIHCYFCFSELLVHFSAFTTFPLKLILDMETEPIVLPRPHGREVTPSQMPQHLWSRIMYILHFLIKVSICIQYFFCFQNQIQFYHSEFQAEKQIWIQRKSSRQQKLTTLWDAGVFPLRLSRVSLETSLE